MQVQSVAVKKQIHSDNRPDTSVLPLSSFVFSTSWLTFLLRSSGTSAVDFLHMAPRLCLTVLDREPPWICIV